MHIIINGIFPWYFITHIPVGWYGIAEPSWSVILIFGSVCWISICIQYFLGRAVLRLRPSPEPKIYLLLFAVHNAGYLPLPILSIIAAQEIVVYLYFYILAFNMVFWTVPLFVFRKNKGIQISYPLIGLLIGMFLALTKTYHFLPYRDLIYSFSEISLPGAMFVLGGGLAAIPRSTLKLRAEIRTGLVLRHLLYPLAVFGIASLFALAPTGIAAGEFRTFLTVEAIMPPASNFIVLANMYGTARQAEYTGNMMLWHYLATIIALPLLLLLLHWI